MHCDIKEPNIMFADRDYANPRTVLIDFGLGRPSGLPSGLPPVLPSGLPSARLTPTPRFPANSLGSTQLLDLHLATRVPPTPKQS